MLALDPMLKKWTPILEFFTLATMVAFATFIIVSILTVMTNISNTRIYG